MNNLNTYKKYCPNVFVAKCTEEKEKGDIIILTTKYGKENEHEVCNFLGTLNGSFLYSITRVDGFNHQERAKAKAEKLNGYASNAEKRSIEAYKKSDMSESTTGIPFGQPILIGHHSERGHRKIIERAWTNMGKSIAEDEKAKDYINRAEYWERKANTINLSMPESLGFFEFKLEEAKKNHKVLKDDPSKRAHSYSLTYANKEVNNVTKNLNLAVKLWGSEEEIKQIQDEKQEQAVVKSNKSKKSEDLIKKYGGFFAFNNDQLKEGYAKILESGHVTRGEKVKHVMHGLYIPSKNIDAYLNKTS